MGQDNTATTVTCHTADYWRSMRAKHTAAATCNLAHRLQTSASYPWTYLIGFYGAEGEVLCRYTHLRQHVEKRALAHVGHAHNAHLRGGQQQGTVCYLHNCCWDRTARVMAHHIASSTRCIQVILAAVHAAYLSFHAVYTLLVTAMHNLQVGPEAAQDGLLLDLFSLLLWCHLRYTAGS